MSPGCRMYAVYVYSCAWQMSNIGSSQQYFLFFLFWAPSICGLCSTLYSKIWMSPSYDLSQQIVNCERLGGVSCRSLHTILRMSPSCTRLQAISVRFEDMGSAWLQDVNFECLDIVTCILLHNSNHRLGYVCLQSERFQAVAMKLSASHVCSICTIIIQLQFSVSGWPIPISWRYFD